MQTVVLRVCKRRGNSSASSYIFLFNLPRLVAAGKVTHYLHAYVVVRKLWACGVTRAQEAVAETMSVRWPSWNVLVLFPPSTTSLYLPFESPNVAASASIEEGEQAADRPRPCKVPLNVQVDRWTACRPSKKKGVFRGHSHVPHCMTDIAQRACGDDVIASAESADRFMSR